MSEVVHRTLTGLTTSIAGCALFASWFWCAWLLVVYLLYLAFELYSWWVVRIPGSRARAPLGVLLVYPIYGAINTVLRSLSLFVWAWLRFVTGSMRAKRDERDRVPA